MTDLAPVRLLDADGTVTGDGRYPMPPPDVLLERYRGLVRGKRLNEQASALVRQGRLAVYPSSRGQEACEVVAAAVLRPGDWLFPPTATPSPSSSAGSPRSRS